MGCDQCSSQCCRKRNLWSSLELRPKVPLPKRSLKCLLILDIGRSMMVLPRLMVNDYGVLLLSVSGWSQLSRFHVGWLVHHCMGYHFCWRVSLIAHFASCGQWWFGAIHRSASAERFLRVLGLTKHTATYMSCRCDLILSDARHHAFGNCVDSS